MILLPFLLIAWGLVSIPAHLVLTFIVLQDAKKLCKSSLNISPFLWAAISFMLPVIGMLIYWVMNHSSLNTDNSK